MVSFMPIINKAIASGAIQKVIGESEGLKPGETIKMSGGPYNTKAEVVPAPGDQRAVEAAKNLLTPPAPSGLSLQPTSFASESIYKTMPGPERKKSQAELSVMKQQFAPLLKEASGIAALSPRYQSLQIPAVQQAAMQGRGGDSMLVHMRPDEVAAMQRMARQAGTSMTINPMTGLPEAFKLKDLFNINTYTKPIRSAAEKIGLGGLSDAISSGFSSLGKNAQYILPFIPGGAFAGLGSLGSFAASPMGRGLLAGGIGSLAGGRFNLKRGLMSGLTAYGLSGAYQGLQGAGGGVGEATRDSLVNITPPEGAVFEGSLGTYVDAAGNPITSLPGVGAIPEGAQIISQPGVGDVMRVPGQPAAAPGIAAELKAAGRGLANIATGDKAAMQAFSDKFGRGAVGATYLGITGGMALDEQEKMLEEAKAQQRISDAEYATYRARIENAKRRAREAVKANPYQFAVGGEINDQYVQDTPMLGGKGPEERNVFGLASGGMPPRYVDGPGDGMSDSIRARIGGLQEARIADGEFIIPADVVSHLGNGSSKAGAKQLYSMMDRVRKARTGTTKQGKEIKPTKFMPA